PGTRSARGTVTGFAGLSDPHSNLTVAMATTAGAGSLIIGVLLVVLGISLWYQRHIRTFAGVAAILLALVSLPVSNFGGFVMGFLLALVGGAMAVAWSPGAPSKPQPEGEIPPAGDDAPEQAAYYPGPDGVESNDLSGTSPMNGANGRHSAG
ncbi:DUF6114 domain-containing protein, partial [Streptomyces sp. NPDC007162]|uniref:DUF6114 domain-containing protein n=1 Tax=Streptomyces sp. NPDC007162 TaxID=3156917 RepID=UPI0033F45931